MPNTQNYAFTVYNYTNDHEKNLKDFLTTHEGQVKYLEYGHEVCPTTNKPHLQGFISTPEYHSKKAMINILGANMGYPIGKDPKKPYGGITAKGCKGTALSNCSYVGKERDDVFRYGTIPIQSTPDVMNENKKRKATEMITLAKQRKLNEIEKEYPSEYIQRYTTLQKISQEIPEAIEWLIEPPAILIYGESGSGKSYYVRKTYPNLYVKSKERFDSWDNFFGQDNVLIEDVSPEFIRSWYEMLLVVLDIYPFPAKRLYGLLPGIRPKNIIFTSMYSMQELTIGLRHPEAFKRRFKEIKNKIKDF